MNKLIAGLLALIALGASAQVIDVAAERARIAAGRKAADERFKAEEKACYARFAVTDCVAEAKVRRREAVGELRRQEIALNDLERKDRAAKRLREIEERNSNAKQEQAANQRAKAQVQQQGREQRSAGKAKKQEPRAEAAPKAPRTPKPMDPAEAAEHRRQYEDKLRDAEEHRKRVAKHLAERKKPPAAPLPAHPASGN